MSSISPAAGRISTDGRSLRLARLGDELLARQAARGSERAFTALYQRYYQPLYRYCRSIVRDDADAQDALQSAFTSALAALRRDARNAPLRPWLYRIAHNESISLLRRRKRDMVQEAADEVSALGASAEEEAAARARWQRVVEDLAELPERQRGSLLLRELAGLSHEEIALTFGTTVGAAKQAIFEARQGLAELEEGRSMSCEEVRRRISAGDRRLLRGRRVNAHLRDCGACAAFASAIPARESDLRALAPALPPAAAAALLGRVIRAASPHGGASAGSAAGAAAVGKTATTVIGWKALATVGVLAGAAAGATGLTHAFHHAPAAAHPAFPAPAALSRAAGGHTTSAGSGPSHARATAGQIKATAHRAAARSRHAAGHGAGHHHGASHPRGAASSSAGAGSPSSRSAAGSGATSNSHASGGQGQSGPGRTLNRGVRRHGSASTTHASRSHSVARSQTHPAIQTSQTRSSGATTTATGQHSTSSPTQTAGSPTAVLNDQGHGTTTPSTPVTVAPPHAVSGAPSK